MNQPALSASTIVHAVPRVYADRRSRVVADSGVVMRWREFVQTQLDSGAVGVIGDAQPRAARNAALETECQALDAGPAFVDRSYRALLEVTGADRATWLHNLTTNQVKNLGRGEGNYAFALNIQGRILFDLNLLVRADSIWLDLDRRFLETAKKHFAKYTITEDVAVADRSEEFVRFGLVGAKAATLLGELGAPNAAAMAQLNHVTIDLSIADQSRDREGADKQNRNCQGAVFAAATSNRSMPVAVLMVRHDFCGPFAVELFVPAEEAVDLWRTHVNSGKAVPVGDEVVQVRRIEAGIPWPGHEITDEYLPAETRQLDRAVSFQKGCYLGQEVVERMRSRHVVARWLVGLRLEGPPVPPLKSQIFTPSPSEGEGRGEDPKPTGQVTSACHSPTLGCPIALAYVRTPHATPGTQLTMTSEGESAICATVVDLPFTA
ncbi:MAG: glycine cleavage T C-terminal barrel domain-containing protein [Planctomycetota bacterium]